MSVGPAALRTTQVRWPGLGHTLLRIYVLLVYVFLFAPIAVTIGTSLNADRFVMLPWRGFTWHWYEQVIGTSDLLFPLRNSLLVATGVGVMSVVLGFLGAYGLLQMRGRWQDLLMLGLISPLAVPWILLGLGLLVFFTRLGIPRSLLAVWITHTIFAAPLAMLIIRARLLGLRRSYEEAAWDLGAGRLRTIWEVVIPLCAPGLVGAFLLTFTLSFDEFILAWFVCGFDLTLPVKIWGMMRSGINPTISAIGTIVFALSITLSVVGQLLQRRGAAT